MSLRATNLECQSRSLGRERLASRWLAQDGLSARRTWWVKRLPIADARLLAPEADDGDLDASWARTGASETLQNADR